MEAFLRHARDGPHTTIPPPAAISPKGLTIAIVREGVSCLTCRHA